MTDCDILLPFGPLGCPSSSFLFAIKEVVCNIGIVIYTSSSSICSVMFLILSLFRIECEEKLARVECLLLSVSECVLLSVINCKSCSSPCSLSASPSCSSTPVDRGVDRGVYEYSIVVYM